MHALFRAMACCGILAVATASPGADWPTYRHDNRRSGVTAEDVQTPLTCRWVFRSPAGCAPGWSPPVAGYGFVQDRPNVAYDDAFRVVVAGDTAWFCASGENCVYAVGLADGRVRWRHFTAGAARHAPVVWRGRVFFGDDDGCVTCLGADDGKVLWRFGAAGSREKMLGYGRFSSLWPVRGGVMIDDGVVYLTAGLFPAEGIELIALDAETGAVRYRRSLDHGRFAGPAPQGYLLAAGEDLFLTGRARTLRAEKKTGLAKPTRFPVPTIERSHNWKGVLFGSNARIFGGQLVVGNGCVGFFDPDASGKDKYGRKFVGALRFDIPHACEVIIDGPTAYVLSRSHLAAYPADELADVAGREYRAYHKAFGECDVAGKIDVERRYAQIVGAGGEDDPRAVEMKRTKFKWGAERWKRWETVEPKVTAALAKRSRWLVPCDAHETMILAGGSLLIGGRRGLRAVDARTGKTLWRDETSGAVRGLAVAGGCLLASTTDGTVRCYAPAAPAAGPKRVAARQASSRPADAATAALAAKVRGASPWRRGHALIVGAGDVRLAAALARTTKLTVTVLAATGAAVRPMREALADEGLYGHRVTVEKVAGAKLPFAPYLFNLVVDEGAIRGRGETAAPAELARVARPLGGVVLLGAGDKPGELPDASFARQAGPGFVKLTRGRLPGSKNWTHNYATPGNTYCSESRLVKAPFGVLWYGEPGPADRIERHSTPPVPLIVDGRVVTLGYDRVIAYDAYNGIELWRREILGVTASHMGLDTPNIAAEGSSVFVLVGRRECLELDLATGRTLRTIPPPAWPGRKESFWSYLAVDERTIYGSRSEIDTRRRRPQETTSDAVFALDRRTGRLRWAYEGGGIEHVGICLAGGRMFLIDGRLTDSEKRRAVGTPVPRPAGEAVPTDGRGRALPPRLGKLVAIDAAKGTVLWRRPLELTDMTIGNRVLAGSHGSAGTVGCMATGEHIVVHGSGSFGHPWKSFLAGKFSRRSLYVYTAADGRFVWGGRRGYRKRPIVVGEWIYAEPSAWHVETGRQKMIANPLSGLAQPLDMHRGYIGCGHLLASGAAIFGNSNGGIAAWNVASQAGYTPFGDVWLGCGLGMAPGGGVLVAFEGRSGCNCPTPIHTSIVLYPRREARAWAGGAAGGMFPDQVKNLPVRHLRVNLGAPGLREDGDGGLFLAYPSEPHASATALVGDWLPKYKHSEEMFFRQRLQDPPVTGTKTPWLYTCGYRADKPLAFPLRAKGSGAGKYTVRLHFAEPDDLPPGRRVFDVRLQGQTVLAGLDVSREAGGPRKALVKSFRGVEVRDRLTIELAPTQGSRPRKPILCALEALAE